MYRFSLFIAAFAACGGGLSIPSTPATSTQVTFYATADENVSPFSPTANATTFQSARVAGTPQVLPSESDLTEMRRNNERMLHSEFWVCVDKSGAVQHVEVIRTSSYRDYDRKVSSELKKWQFSAGDSAGCTSLQFVFDFSNR